MDAARPDNKGDGKSQAFAWRDFEPFIGRAVAGGDTLYLKRGSRWENTCIAFYSGGTVAKPFMATAYGDPSLPLPSISDTSSDHNTFVQNSRRSGSAVGTSLKLLDSTQIRLRDNLFTGDSLAASLYFGPFDRAGNLFWSRNFPEKWELPLAPGELSAEPLLAADTSTLDYVLSSKSPARDAATVLTCPGSLGTLHLPSVPDGKPDIGALEVSLVDPGGRLVFALHASHPAGAVEEGWDLPRSREGLLLTVDMDGIRQAVALPPVR